MNPKIVHILACFFGATGVILGALGAHALKEKIDSLKIDSFKTGVLYQLLHALVLLYLGSNAEKLAASKYNIAVYCFVLGICLFSGSIYLLSTRELIGLNKYEWLGPITPLGGLLFIIGWITLAFSYKN